jgi:hypothetical protein
MSSEAGRPRVVAVVLTEEAAIIFPPEVICQAVGHVPGRETAGALTCRACRARLCPSCDGTGLSTHWPMFNGHTPEPQPCGACGGSGGWEEAVR